MASLARLMILTGIAGLVAMEHQKNGGDNFTWTWKWEALRFAFVGLSMGGLELFGNSIKRDILKAVQKTAS